MISVTPMEWEYAGKLGVMSDVFLAGGSILLTAAIGVGFEAFQANIRVLWFVTTVLLALAVGCGIGIGYTRKAKMRLTHYVEKAQPSGQD